MPISDRRRRSFGRLTAVGVVLLAASLLLTVSAASNAASSAPPGGPVREARALEPERTGLQAPVGLAFSASSRAFYAVEQAGAGAPAGQTDVVELTPFASNPDSDRAGTARIAAAVGDPINTAFDPVRNRLLLLGNAGQLLELRAGADGTLDPQTLSHSDAVRLGLKDAQGMSVDPASGALYILDAAGPRIVRLEPAADGSFQDASTSEIALAGLANVRGLALDPASGHLFLRSGSSLEELTASGQLVSERDLFATDLASPQGMVFAPSGDATDAPSQQSLYVADAGGGSRQSSGQVAELSLAAPAAPAAPTFTSSLVRTTDTAAWSPRSPDPSGIAYVPASDRLVVVDGEVEETVAGITHFAGANVWETTRSGSVIRSANVSKVQPTVVPMTNEPTGVAWEPSTGHYWVSSDDGQKVFNLNPGADTLIGTADDSWSFFSTTANGNTNGDPEGIAFDTFSSHVFVADGVNAEIYEYTKAGVLVNHFDVAQYGVQDPETVEFNPASDTLFTLSNQLSGPIIVETTTAGALLQTINVSAANSIKPAGLAIAPASDGSGAQRFYWVDRGIDNNTDPNIVDGKMYEMTAPTSGPPANTPPSVNAGTDQSATLPASANLDATVTDDGKPNPPASVTTTWSQVSGPATVTFGNPSAIDTTASVPVAGVYGVRLTANDGQFVASDDATLTFTGSGSVSSLDIRVNAPADDSEEVGNPPPSGVAIGKVQNGDGDLDLMTDQDGSVKQVVGVRFNGLGIPQGASISSAYVQFTTDKIQSVATSLTIKGQAADNPVTFNASNAFDLSTRPTTTASASWAPDPWPVVLEAGFAERTPNLAAIVQEIVNRSGWTSGNSLVVLITGSGRRTAVAYNSTTNNGPANAALLHVEWTTGGGGGNSAPAITSDGGGATATVARAENQTAVTDVDAVDAEGDTLTYSISGGADAARFAINASTGVLTFVSAPDFEVPTDAGANNVYDVTVSVSDGHGNTDSQAIAVTVLNVNEFVPVITSNGGGATAAISKPENQTAVTTVTATDADGDPLTYSISGGADQAAFTINASTGVLTFVSAPDFENPTDSGGNNIYDVTVDASDGSLADTQAIAVTVTDVAEGVNQAPVITSDGGGATASKSVPENQTAVTDVDATDADNDPLTYSISGGVDSAKFTINTSTGVLTFVSAPDFENPTDSGGNNIYDVTVSVSDGKGGSDSQAIAVTVTDVPEGAASPVYFSLQNAATLGGTSVANEDVVFFDGTNFSLAFDGSDVGLAPLRIDAFDRLSATSFLFSFDAPGTIPGIAGTVDDSDIVRFDATSLGATTAGTFSMYFDGSDVGMTTNAHDLDALEVLPSGHLLISTTGTLKVQGITASDEDIVDFAPTSLGDTTAGSFSLYFDGSDVGLSATDIDALAVDASGRLYLSTSDAFAVTGLSGQDEDVCVFTPQTLGSTTTGTFSPALYFDGSVYGLDANDVFAIDLP